MGRRSRHNGALPAEEHAMTRATDPDHADDPEPPDYGNRNELLRKKDHRALDIDRNFGHSELDTDGDIADETPGHRN
jgi:hypothetical protein